MSIAKLEMAAGGLAGAGATLAPFSLVSGKAGVQRRIALVKQFAALVAGEDPAALLRAACGPDNETTRRVRGWHTALQEAVEKKGGGGKKAGMSRQQREAAVLALSFVAPQASRAAMKEMGFEIGGDLHRAAKAFGNSGGTAVTPAEGSKRGRKRHRSSAAVAKAWEEMSHPSGRLSSKGECLRIVPGGLEAAAKRIAIANECSRATAHRVRPDTVIAPRKHTDLCKFCEALRRTRLACIRAAIGRGGEFAEPDEFAGQKAVAAPGKAAEAYLRENFAGDPDVAVLLKRCATLATHEELGEAMAQKMRGEYGKRLAVCFDFSADAQLTSARGDAQEFFSPQTISLFGAMFVVPKNGGQFERHYVDVLSFAHTGSSCHTSKVAAASLRQALDVAIQRGIVDTLEGASFYSDKGRHFCSGEMCYELLLEATAGADEVSYTYHACYHGKTALDGHFANVKQRVDGIFVERWPKTQDEVKDIIVGPIEGLGNTNAVFLDDDYVRDIGRRRLVVHNISCVQELRRKRCPATGGDALTVGTRSVAIKSKPARESEPGPAKISRERGCVDVDIDALCSKLESAQKKADWYYA